jgi:hypothetical protein
MSGEGGRRKPPRHRRVCHVPFVFRLVRIVLIQAFSLLVRLALQVLRGRMRCVGAAFQVHGPADLEFCIGVAGAGLGWERIGSARASATGRHGLTLFQAGKSAASHSGSNVSTAKILRARALNCQRERRDCDQRCCGDGHRSQWLFHSLSSGTASRLGRRSRNLPCRITGYIDLAQTSPRRSRRRPSMSGTRPPWSPPGNGAQPGPCASAWLEGEITVQKQKAKNAMVGPAGFEPAPRPLCTASVI